MHVLLTGHQGYIGSVLAKMLLQAGHDVSGLDSGFFQRNRFVGELANVPCLRRDLRDVESRDLEGYEAVLHIAALSNDPLGDINPPLTYEINFHASTRLARLLKQVGKRFLFSSSCSMYGAAGSEMLGENSPFNPVTPYAESKVLAERELTNLADSQFMDNVRSYFRIKQVKPTVVKNYFCEKPRPICRQLKSVINLVLGVIITPFRLMPQYAIKLCDGDTR
jgi:nucleoside-diphosphate-sugar epimerase